MTKTITLIRGDDTNFFDKVLLVVSFKTFLNLDGYKLRLTIENPTNIIKQYEVQNNLVEINFDKIDSSTFSIGKHKANLKLIDTFGRVKTIYYFTIMIQDSFGFIPQEEEYEIEIELQDDGISKYKNYNELINKPKINGIELVGDIILNNNEFILDIASPLVLNSDNKLAIKIDEQTIQLNSDGELVVNMDELGNEVNTIASRLLILESQLNSLIERVTALEG